MELDLHETIINRGAYPHPSDKMGCGAWPVLCRTTGSQGPSTVPGSVEGMNSSGEEGQSSKDARDPRTSAGAAHHKPSPRVFVVDDEDFIRELYKDVFESQGITVFSAESGDEAIDIFRTMKYKPDLVIMDYRMPGKDGIQTTRELLEMDPSVPVVFSSADKSVRERALEAGAVSFWSKPFPVGLLVNAMFDILDAKKKNSF